MGLCSFASDATVPPATVSSNITAVNVAPPTTQLPRQLSSLSSARTPNIPYPGMQPPSSSVPQQALANSNPPQKSVWRSGISNTSSSTGPATSTGPGPAASTGPGPATSTESLAQGFYDDKQKLIKDLEHRYERYVTQPKLHPSYESVLDSFNLQNTGTSWDEFWMQELRKLRIADYKSDLVVLVNKYKELTMNAKLVGSGKDTSSVNESAASSSTWRYGTSSSQPSQTVNRSEVSSLSNVRSGQQNYNAGNVRQSDILPNHNNQRTLPAHNYSHGRSSWHGLQNSQQNTTMLNNPNQLQQSSYSASSLSSDKSKVDTPHNTSQISQIPSSSSRDPRKLAKAHMSASVNRVDVHKDNNASMSQSLLGGQSTVNPSLARVPAQTPAASHENVEPIYQLLEKLAPIVGKNMAPVLTTMIAVARKRGSNTPQAFKLFKDAEITKLLKLCIEKFYEASKTATDSIVKQEYILSAKGAQFLMDYSKQVS